MTATANTNPVAELFTELDIEDQTPVNPVTELLEELATQAQAVTLANYQDFLHIVASLVVDGSIDGIQREAVINALVGNDYKIGNKRLITNALNSAEKQVRRDMHKPESGMVQGGRGVYGIRDGWLYRSTEKGDYPVCTAIDVLGRTRNPEQGGWGKLLEWKDGDGKVHTWAMPMRLMSGDGTEVIGALMDRGLVVAGGSNQYVADYLQMCESERRLTCVEKTGWHAGRVFVTPNKVYGDDDGSIIYQGAIKGSDQKTRGTLEGWRDEVASLAIGNSRMTFALSSAFAPALLDLAPSVGVGGFQFTGSTKDGKTLVLRSAASVHGYHMDVKQQWRGSILGIEALATRHNDGWLFIDEQGMALPHEVERVIYMLAEGKDKATQTQKKELRNRNEWKMLWFSTGEISAAEHIATKGGTPPAGIEMRQSDIPVDAGKGYKIHDTIQDYADLNSFNSAIGAGIENHYGVVGAEWLEMLVEQRGGLDTIVPDKLAEAAKEIGGNTASPQTRDALYRFALVAVAGEMATEYGLTGWQAGQATAAAKRVFKDWLVAFGGDSNSREQRQIVDAVRAFLNSNMSRFQNMAFVCPKEEIEQVRNCMGAMHPAYDEHSKAVFLVFNSQLKELAKGYSKKQIVDALEQAGMILPPIKDGREYIPAHGQQRVTRIITADETED